MARFRGPQNAFSNGEISALAQGRTNIQEYSQGLNVMENALNLAQGGVTKRGGMEIFKDTFGSGGYRTALPHKIIPFNYADDEKYIITIGRLGLAAYNANDGTYSSIPIFAAPAGDTQGMRAWQSPALDFRDIQQIQYAMKGALLFIVMGSEPPIIVRRTALNTLEYAVFHTIAEGDTDAHSHERWPYREKNYDEDHMMYFATRTPGARAVVSQTGAGVAVPYFDSGMIGSPFFFGEGGAVAGYGTITAVADSSNATVQVIKTIPAIYNTGSGGNGHHEWHESAWSDYRGWPRTVAFHESRVYYGGNTAEPGKGWGSQANDLYEMTNEELDISAAVAPTPLNTNAHQFTLSGAKYSQIQWMVGGRTLRMGTTQEEHIVEGSDRDDIFGRVNLIGGSLSTTTGSRYVQPVMSQSNVYFAQRSGTRVREFTFNRDVNNYKAKDVTVLAEQAMKRSVGIFNDGVEPQIAELAVQSHDAATIWGIDNNGALFSGTVDRDVGVVGWQRHILSGTHAQKTGALSGVTPGSPTTLVFNTWHNFVDGDEVKVGDFQPFGEDIRGVHTLTYVSPNTFTIPAVTATVTGADSYYEFSSTSVDSEPRIVSICTLPSDDNTNDDLWAWVIQTYDGVNRGTLQNITKMFDGTRLDEQSTDQIKKPIYLDGAVMSQVASFPNGTASLTHSGFDLYDYETVSVLADGKYIGEKTVSSAGVITLDTAAQEVIAGRLYSMKIETLPMDYGSVLGSAFTAVQRIEKVLTKLYKTAFLKIGQDFLTMDDIDFTDVNIAQNLPVALYTGVKELDFPGDYDRESTVCLMSDVPYPCTISGLVNEGLTYDD